MYDARHIFYMTSGKIQGSFLLKMHTTFARHSYLVYIATCREQPELQPENLRFFSPTRVQLCFIP